MATFVNHSFNGGQGWQSPVTVTVPAGQAGDDVFLFFHVADTAATVTTDQGLTRIIDYTAASVFGRYGAFSGTIAGTGSLDVPVTFSSGNLSIYALRGRDLDFSSIIHTAAATAAGERTSPALSGLTDGGMTLIFFSSGENHIGEITGAPAGFFFFLSQTNGTQWRRMVTAHRIESADGSLPVTTWPNTATDGFADSFTVHIPSSAAASTPIYDESLNTDDLVLGIQTESTVDTAAGPTLPAGWTTITLVAPLASAGQRLTAIEDLVAGDVIAYDPQGGNVIVYSDGSFSTAAGVTSFQVAHYLNDTLGTIATQTIETPPIIISISESELTVGQTGVIIYGVNFGD